jgi:choline dehydrogenase-like flavoprotein
MGGATLGYALARSGMRVLFLEKGRGDPQPGLVTSDLPDTESRLARARWPTAFSATLDGKDTEFLPPIGCGVGGSSLLYAAALERLEPVDFAGTGGFPAWPFSYADLAPFYREAEQLFGVHGGPDPLSEDDAPLAVPRGELSTSDRRIFRQLERAGLHPYRLHVGNAYSGDCAECLGYVCDRRCKSDVKLKCIEPAVATGNAQVLDRCEVVRLEAGRERVQEVVANHRGQLVRFKAHTVVLAAGAFASAALLLRSGNAHWPEGLANRSGMVGRNLMLHLTDYLAIWAGRSLQQRGPRKTIGVRDFYTHRGELLGTLQSTGLTAGYGNIVGYLGASFDRRVRRELRFMRPLIRIPAAGAAAMFGRASIFATILQDIPYAANRVTLDERTPSGIHVHYAMHEELLRRHRTLRALIRQSLKGLRHAFISREPEPNFGHPCGTCRAGVDSALSVLNRDNRTHDAANLYVVDAAFMPSSGGTNPALTIAANALRVAAPIRRDIERARMALAEVPGGV